MGFHIAEFFDFPAPVDHDGGRTDDEEAGLHLGHCQVGHGRDGLDGLAQAHLIAQEDPLLGQDIAGSEGLVGAEIPLEGAQVQVCGVDLRSKLGGNAGVDGLLRGADAAQRLQQGVVGRAVFAKIIQGSGFVCPDRPSVQGQEPARTSAEGSTCQFHQGADGQDRPLLFLPAGKDPAQPVADLHCLNPALDLRVEVPPQRLRVPQDQRHLTISAEEGDQGADIRIPGFTGYPVL